MLAVTGGWSFVHDTKGDVVARMNPLVATPSVLTVISSDPQLGIGQKAD